MTDHDPPDPPEPTAHLPPARLPEADRSPTDRSPADLRRARREFLFEAALEAERDTGRRERTDEEARRSLWMRLAQLVAGWILVLLGLAAIPLPGPGWLMVILGLTLLPYRWTDNLIRQIRRRIPGIPEDGRIPTRTWVITGLLVALATTGSLWWGLRDRGDDRAAAQNAEHTLPTKTLSPSAAINDDDVTSSGPVIVTASPDDPGRRQLSAIYGSVAAAVTGGTVGQVSSADPCSSITSGGADLVLLTESELPACFGPDSDQVARTRDAGVKIYAPVVAGGVTYHVAVRAATIAIDDEPAELALDGVSAHISTGYDISGDPAARAQAVLAEAGVFK